MSFRGVDDDQDPAAARELAHEKRPGIRRKTLRGRLHPKGTVEFRLEKCGSNFTHGAGLASGPRDGVRHTPSYLRAEPCAMGVFLPPIQLLSTWE